MFKGSQLNSILSILILTAGCHGPEEGPVTTNGKPAAAQPLVMTQSVTANSPPSAIAGT